MVTHPQLPADVAAAFDRYPEAGNRFASIPAEQQAEWLAWVDEARGSRGRAQRIDELVRRLVPAAAGAQEEVVEQAAPPPERHWWLWLLLLLVLVVGGLLAWYFLSRGDDKTTVPNVIGLRGQQAAVRIQDNDLDAVPRTGQSDRPQGVVFAQRPGAGTQLGKGQDVTIFISAGSLGIPDVTGLPVNDAQQQLETKGFEVTVKRVASSKQKGIVIEQDPAAGVAAANGTTVTLTVSNGIKPVVVPRVVGQEQGAAVGALTKLGLKSALKNVPSAQPAGTVVAQNPPAGKEVDKGSQVKLNVSTGTPSTTTVQTTSTVGATTTAAASAPLPRLVGLGQTTAQRRLNAMGLRPTVVYVRSTRPVNRVLSQAPAAATTLRRGSRVRITVSTGANPQPATSIPNVVGQDQATAVETLRSAGFKVLVLNRQTTDASKDGLVVEQQPRAGSSIPGGLLVTIFVGRSG
jgi:beta-lactam-binding protein with PASTA domain